MKLYDVVQLKEQFNNYPKEQPALSLKFSKTPTPILKL